MSWIARIKRWLRAQVQEVPEALAVCEFDCDRPDCRMGDWQSCERRLGYGALVEGHADSAPAPSPEPTRAVAPGDPSAARRAGGGARATRFAGRVVVTA